VPPPRERCPAPKGTRGCDLTGASLDTLVLVLGEAVRLDYGDARQNHPARIANPIADALCLAHWNDLQQLQLRYAYMAGREHVAAERIHGHRTLTVADDRHGISTKQT
jgi:hypothetical protein